MTQNPDISGIWSLVYDYMERAEKDLAKSYEDARIAKREAEEAEIDLENYLQNLKKTGIFEDLESGCMLKAILTDKILEKDAKFGFYSKGAKKVFEDSYSSFSNVLNAKVEDHNMQLLSLL